MTSSDGCALLVLWACSSLYPDPQIVAAWPQSVHDHDPYDFERQRSAAEQAHVDRFPTDGPAWSFFTMLEQVSRPEPAELCWGCHDSAEGSPIGYIFGSLCSRCMEERREAHETAQFEAVCSDDDDDRGYDQPTRDWSGGWGVY